MTAPDAASGGFTAQLILAGTNFYDTSQDWVELGATQGWQGQNIYTYYTAQGSASGGYSEQRITAITPSYGTTHRFAAFQRLGLPEYWASIDSNGYWSWPGKSPNTVAYLGGHETTCGEQAKVNRTYVSENEFRRLSDGVWVSAANGQLNSPQGYGSIAWCSSPVTFRHWMRSDLDPSLCS